MLRHGTRVIAAGSTGWRGRIVLGPVVGEEDTEQGRFRYVLTYVNLILMSVHRMIWDPNTEAVIPSAIMEGLTCIQHPGSALVLQAGTEAAARMVYFSYLVFKQTTSFFWLCICYII
jgi:hypothetical protein